MLRKRKIGIYKYTCFYCGEVFRERRACPKIAVCEGCARARIHQLNAVEVGRVTP